LDRALHPTEGIGVNEVPRNDDQDNVRAFYDAGPDHEWTRLERHRTEFALTWRAISEGLKELGEKPGRPEAAGRRGTGSPARLKIIDIGGGPGRYSLLLDRAGHEVTLVDLAPANVEYARKATGGRLAGYLCGTATDLGVFRGGTFDAALLLGPLYHLLDAADRRLAVAEAGRVLAPGGLLFASFITVFAPLRDMAKNSPEEILSYFPAPSNLAEWIKDGRWPSRPGGGFTNAYFIHPSAVRPFMEAAGDLATLSVLGLEGIPAILGGAEHILYVGRKREG
jgi:SAM-dependent methyltransferase